MTKDEKDRIKVLETEIAYLRKEIEKFMTEKTVEFHYHYTYDYDKMKEILDYFKQQMEQ